MALSVMKGRTSGGKRRTSNIEHRTSNVQSNAEWLSSIQHWMFDVGCSMFAFSFSPAQVVKDRRKHQVHRDQRDDGQDNGPSCRGADALGAAGDVEAQETR